MKYFTFIFLALLGSLISCNSPNQSADNTPVVTLTQNKTILPIGDTLRLTIHAEDPTYMNGMIDYNDNTVFGFNNIKSVFDTTLIHIFRSAGVFNITITFTDGENKTTTKQIRVTVYYDPPPIVTLTVNRTMLNIADTLKVNLHAVDSTLTSGSMDFKDGTVIIFSNLNYLLDTTIMHVYLQNGSYSITATFNDGYSSTKSSTDVTITNLYYYSLSFSVGMVWRYHYNSSTSVGPYVWSQSGIHRWTITSFTEANQDTTYTVQQIINDTTWNYAGQGEKNDTTEFTIVVSHNSILFNSPLAIGTFSIPNNSYITSYSINFGIYGSYIKFADIIGLTTYYYNPEPGHGGGSDDLTLIDFTKP